MDTIDKIVSHITSEDVPINRGQVEKRLQRTGENPDAWLAQLEQAARDIKDPEYMKADPTGVVDMDKFSSPLNVHVGHDDGGDN